MQMVQVEFSRPLGNNSSMFDSTVSKIVWVNASWNLKPGHMVKFKDDEEYEWKVVIAYEFHIDAADIYTKWGLDLPKSQRTER